VTTTQQGTLRPEVSERDHQLGPAGAPITLVEYGDLQCPHCRRAHGVIPRVMRRLGDRMRFVFRHFPITESHPNALHAAEVAESVAAQAGEQAFWKMHDLLYEHQPEWEDADDDARILELAKEAGANPETVAADLEFDRYEERVKEDFMSGVRSGVNGTPTFFINGRRFDGDWTSVDTFVAALEAAEK
jgi:protein-disulfide isomerase